MGRFDGKVALLTGAASGIGRATAVRLADEGASVFGIDVNADGLAETAGTVTAAGGSMSTRVTDITSVSECAAAVDACVAEFGRLDVLGNIAGVHWMKNVADVGEAEWDLMFAVNVKGVFFLMQAAVPHLIESEGNIVNIASNSGKMGCAYNVAYGATKAAVINMTKAMAMEFAKSPIRVNAVAPGGTDTPMTQNSEMPDELDFSLMKRYMAFRDMAPPEQLAAVVAFVASDDAAVVHGAIVSADNGLTAG